MRKLKASATNRSRLLWEKPSKQSSFTAGGIEYRVAEVEFPEPGAFSYRLEGSDQFHTIQMDSLVGY
jgi:hypothetical protein